jgi:hypothetical protein
MVNLLPRDEVYVRGVWKLQELAASPVVPDVTALAVELDVCEGVEETGIEETDIEETGIEDDG